MFLTGTGILSALLPPVGLSGCGGSGRLDDDDPVVTTMPEAGQAYTGRVTSVVTWELPADLAESLTAEHRQQIADSGARLLDDPPRLISSELPLRGHWVGFGEERCMIGVDGVFTIESLPAGVTEARVYTQISDDLPEGTFSLNMLVPAGATPMTAVIDIAYTPPGSMSMDGSTVDTRASAGNIAPDSCPLRQCQPIGSPANCCLDFDGALGDGLDRARGDGNEGLAPGLRAFCNARANINFFGSTCYDWVFKQPGRPCANEGAVNPIAGGPACIDNHKYRYCQVMDVDGFGVSTTRLRVRWDDRVEFHVINRTPANESLLRFREDDAGTVLVTPQPGVRASLRPHASGYELRHYNDSLYNHYDDVTLTYFPPLPDPAQPCLRTVHLIAEGGGHSREIEILIGYTVELDPAAVALDVGASSALSVRALHIDDTVGALANTSFAWSITPDGVATVDGGTITAVAEGTALVTAASIVCDARATASVVVRDPQAPDPPGDDSTLAGEWLGLVAFQNFANGGQWYAVYLSMEDDRGSLSGTYAAVEIDPGPLPPIGTVRDGPIRGSLSGIQGGGSASIRLGAWGLTLNGDISLPEASDDPSYDLFIAGGVDDDQFPGLPFAVGGIDFGRLGG